MRQYMLWAVLLVVFSFSLGCAQKGALMGDSMLEKNWGKSYESTKYKQMLNPDAQKNLDPLTGLDGQAANASVEKYKKTFKGEQGKDVYSINLGAISQVGTE